MPEREPFIIRPPPPDEKKEDEEEAWRSTAKPRERDPEQPQLSIGSQGSTVELLRSAATTASMQKGGGRKTRPRAGGLHHDQTKHGAIESGAAAHAPPQAGYRSGGDEQHLDGDDDSMGSVVGGVAHGRRHKLNRRALVIVIVVASLAGLVVAYVGTGLIILSSMSDGVTTCERPFWQYAYYTLGAPVLLAVIGLTSKHPCGRLLLCVAPAVGLAWSIAAYARAGRLSDPSSCHHQVAHRKPHFYKWIVASSILHAVCLVAVVWLSVSEIRRHPGKRVPTRVEDDVVNVEQVELPSP